MSEHQHKHTMASAPRTDEPDFDVLDMDVDDGDDNVLSSTWEQGYARPWEDLQLDDSGRLKSIDLTRQRNRKRDLPVGSSELVEKGVVRYLYIIMDCSEAMNDIDVRPSRRVAAVDAIQTFLAEFFQQNPISHVGLIVTHSGIAEKLTPLSGNPQLQAQSLRDYRGGGGHIALQRALDIALALMKPVPAYGSREILFVTGSLSTADGAELLKTGEELKKERVRTSVVSLSAEVYAFKMLAHMTGGTFAVATDKEHFNKLIQAQLEPVPVELERAATARRTWIRMGFPRASSETLSYCSCHPKALVTAGYLCPRCDAKYCELPTDCRVCSTTLASAPLLARTYHHLFPVPVYPEVEVMGDRASAPDVQCFSCSTMVQLQDALVSQCPRCERHFCFECDMFIHTKLYNCPGCLCGNISGTSLTNLAARALK